MTLTQEEQDQVSELVNKNTLIINGFTEQERLMMIERIQASILRTRNKVFKEYYNQILVVLNNVTP